MKEKSLKLNSFMNTFKTLMSLVFPLITYPYALRVLQVDNIGKNNYANSIVSYFVLLAGLGISRYAIREGARKRDDKSGFNEFASQMFTLSIISTLLSYCLLFVLMMLSSSLKSYRVLIWVHSITILGTMIGMDWVNSAFEEYTYITIRTIAFQLVSMILLFAIVHDENDIVKYAWISVVSNIGANCLNFFYIRRFASIGIRFRGLKQHIAPIVWLFASSIATTIYVNSDTTMLGYYCGDTPVGLYGVSTKIYSVIKQLLAASIIVALPRLSNNFANNRLDEFKATISGVFSTFTTILLPVMVGLFVLASEAVEVIGGAEYRAATTSLRILCISLGFSIFATFYTNALLMPLKREREITLIMIISATINLLLNIWIIPRFQQDGAAFTTVIAELFVMVSQMLLMRKEKLLRINRKDLISSIVGCAGIIVVAGISFALTEQLLFRIVFTVLGSIFTYYIILLVMKNSIVVGINARIRRVWNKS